MKHAKETRLNKKHKIFRSEWIYFFRYKDWKLPLYMATDIIQIPSTWPLTGLILLFSITFGHIFDTISTIASRMLAFAWYRVFSKSPTNRIPKVWSRRILQANDITKSRNWTAENSLAEEFDYNFYSNI